MQTRLGLAKWPNEWRSEGRVLLAEAALHWIRRQGFSPPLIMRPAHWPDLMKEGCPASWGGPHTIPQCWMLGCWHTQPHPEGHCQHSEEIGRALFYCVPSCVYPTWADKCYLKKNLGLFTTWLSFGCITKASKEMRREKRYNQKVNQQSWRGAMNTVREHRSNDLKIFSGHLGPSCLPLMTTAHHAGQISKQKRMGVEQVGFLVTLIEIENNHIISWCPVP